MNELIMLVGIPASGKTTIAKEYEKNGYVWHSSDEIRLEFLLPQTKEGNIETFNILHRRVHEDLKNGKNVIYDATNMSRKRRIGFLRSLNKIECLKKCIFTLASIETCKERNLKREYPVPDDVYKRMISIFNVPFFTEGWDEIEIVVTDDSEILKINNSDLNVDQENPNHRFTLYNHMKATYDYLIGINREDLATVGFYHDMGKLFTKTYWGDDMKAHYPCHENWSSYLYLSDHRNYFKNHKDKSVQKNDFIQLYNAFLIEHHMRFYNNEEAFEKFKKDISSSKEIAKFNKDFNVDFWNDLNLIHDADIFAH